MILMRMRQYYGLESASVFFHETGIRNDEFIRTRMKQTIGILKHGTAIHHHHSIIV
jgi:hypothetical protein